MPDAPKVNFIDNPHAPEVFASNVSGFAHVAGNIVITLESVRIDHSADPGPVNRVVVGRLMLPVNAAQGLVVGLNDYLNKLGLDPTVAMTGGQTTQ
ncbi:MAG TPA: hypothetical protein VGH03_05915 [Caulobacteraceae bacterium]|jgi:hypothetical protein